MALRNTMTVVADEDVDAFLDGIEDETKRGNSRTLVALFTRATGEPPKLWGSIVGFGRYHYRYDSGHEGESLVVGFASRKAEFSIYLNGAAFPDIAGRRDELLGRLGKHRMGKGCLYVKRLSDVDLAVLEELARLSVDAIRRHYPTKS